MCCPFCVCGPFVRLHVYKTQLPSWLSSPWIQKSIHCSCFLHNSWRLLSDWENEETKKPIEKKTHLVGRSSGTAVLIFPALVFRHPPTRRQSRKFQNKRGKKDESILRVGASASCALAAEWKRQAKANYILQFPIRRVWRMVWKRGEKKKKNKQKMLP